MKSTSTIYAYLLYFGVATQLFFNAPCSGAPMTPSVASAGRESLQKDPVEVKSKDEKNQEPVDQLIEEIVGIQLKELAVMSDQIDRQQGFPALNCTIHIHPSSSATSSSAGESPDLFDQFRNLLINISVWSITSTFSVVREIFNWITNLDSFWNWVVIIVIILIALNCCAYDLAEQLKKGAARPAQRQNGTSQRQKNRPFAGVLVV